MIHPYLTKLGVWDEVQNFFREAIIIDNNADLLFSYDDCVETYGLAFHRIPVTDGIWTAGNNDYALIRQVFVCASAMDAIAFLHFHRKNFTHLDHLLFVATGLRPCKKQSDWIRFNFPNRIISLLLSNDLPGRIADLKIAAWLQRLFPTVTLSGDQLNIRLLYHDYQFDPDNFSLNRFEKESGQRLRCRTFKPKQSATWADQLFQNLAKK